MARWPLNHRADDGQRVCVTGRRVNAWLSVCIQRPHNGAVKDERRQMGF